MPYRRPSWKDRIAAAGLTSYHLGDAPGAPANTRPARPAPPGVGRAAARVFSDLARATRYVDPALADNWPTLVGRELADLCMPGRLSGGRLARTLEIWCSSGAAAARIQFEAETIRRKLNEFMGPGAVGRILVRQRASAAKADPDDRLGAALGRFRSSVSDEDRT